MTAGALFPKILFIISQAGEAKETVKVFALIPHFSREGLGDNAAYLRSITVLFSTR